MNKFFSVFFAAFFFVQAFYVAAQSDESSGHYENENTPFIETEDAANTEVTNIDSESQESVFEETKTQESKVQEEALPQKPKSVFFQTNLADITTGLSHKKKFELGLFAMEGGISNTWFSTFDVINKISNLNKETDVSAFLNDGEFIVESGIFSKPLFVRFRAGNSLVVEISTKVEESTRLVLSKSAEKSLKKLIELQKNYPSDPSVDALVRELHGEAQIAGSSFAALNAGFEFIPHKKIWIRATPSIFVPLFYIPKTDIYLNGDVIDGKKCFTSDSSRNISLWTISENGIGIGFDVALELRYALWPILDIGTYIENISLVPAKLSALSSLNFDIDFSISESGSGLTMKNNIDFSSDDDSTKMISRPLRFGAYTMIKPFSNHILLIKPEAGFSMRSVFAEQIFNWSIETEINLPKILSISIGVKDFEYAWTDYVKLGLDFKYVAIQIGAGLRGQDFVSSWSAKGLSAYVGLSFGY